VLVNNNTHIIAAVLSQITFKTSFVSFSPFYKRVEKKGRRCRIKGKRCRIKGKNMTHAVDEPSLE